MVFRYHRALMLQVFWHYLHGALQIWIWSCAAGEQKVLIWKPDLLCEPSFLHNSFCSCYKLRKVSIQAGLVPSKCCVDLSSQTWKRGGFYKADGSLWSVPTVLFVWMGHAPQSNVSPFPSVKGWEICVRKWEYALKCSLLLTTTPYHIPFPSSGQIYLAGFQQSPPALLKMPQDAKNIILKTSLLARTVTAASAGVPLSCW